MVPAVSLRLLQVSPARRATARVQIWGRTSPGTVSTPSSRPSDIHVARPHKPAAATAHTQDLPRLAQKGLAGLEQGILLRVSTQT